jgi:hypothetical protein
MGGKTVHCDSSPCGARLEPSHWAGLEHEHLKRGFGLGWGNKFGVAIFMCCMTGST